LFWYGIHSLLNRADARGSADIIYTESDAHRYFAGSGRVIEARK